MRRRAIFTTLAVASLALPAFVGTAVATPADTTRGDKRVCVDVAAGYAHCDAHVRTKGARPEATIDYSSGYNPAQLKKAYGLTGLDAATPIAIVDAYAHPSAAADLTVYRNKFGLGTANLTQFNQTGVGALPAGDTGWGQEEMLDLEMVSAICPSCPIIYVGANSPSFADLGTAVKTAAAKGAKVISNSYGGSESASETSIQSAYYTISGVAITVSSGDSGYGAQSPAAFNTVTAVGGTNLVLNPDGTRKAETVWSGAGSGCSAYISKPGWQRDGSCARRTIADVAAVADPATGVAVYDSYGSTGSANWYVFGGTSVAAPIIGGVYGLSGNTAGTPAALLYASPGTLFDVTSGSNGRCVKGRNTAGAYLCTGVVGFDGPTGNGTPNGSLAGF